MPMMIKSNCSYKKSSLIVPKAYRFKVMTVLVMMPFSIFKSTVVGMKTASNIPRTMGEYLNNSKNTTENIIANMQAKNRCHALSTDFFLEGWIQRIVNMPAETTLEMLKSCAM